MSHTNLQTVIGMLRRAAAFEHLPSAQQAALRAQVSRMSRTNTDPQVAEVLGQIKAFVGESELRREAGGMTADDLEAEYRTAFAAYDPRRRASFKSRVTKVRKLAEEANDADAVALLSQLMDGIVEAEEAEARETIRKLAESLRKPE
jgi:hypothetical protein